MRSRAPLVLMEQMVMVLVFALAAALCVQVFVLSDQISHRNEARAQALTVAQSTAEILKHHEGDYEAAARDVGGSWNGAAWNFFCDEDWDVAAEAANAVYRVTVTPANRGHALLGGAEVAVCTADGEWLCALPVAWQEVAP